MTRRTISPLILFLCTLLSSPAILTAQSIDVAKLVHPEVAERLSLTDEQRVGLQKLLQSRAEALVAAPDAPSKNKVKADFETKILGLLSNEQRTKFVEEPPQQKLMFQFREMKWEDVLNWFAAQQDLTLVMDRTPPGTFTYSDTRSYSPSEGIDLLNSVLITRNFSLVRREKMLVVMEMSDSIPIELLPRVKIEELSKRGQFELVTVVFPLGGRPIDAVLGEIKPYLSSYGRVVPLARGSQVIVVETAGKMRMINELIASVPLPQAPPPPEKPVPPPKPIFTAYPLGTLNPSQALETIRKLIPSEQITVDTKTGVLSAYLIPDQHVAVKAAIDQMMGSASEQAPVQSVAYQFSGITADEIKKQVAALVPKAMVTVSANRILVVGSEEEQKSIQASLAGLDIVPVESDKSMQVFEIDPASATTIEAAMKGFLPKSLVAANPKGGTLLVRGPAGDLRVAEEILDMWKRSQSANKSQLRAFPLDRKGDATWLATVQKVAPNANAWLGEEGRQLMMLASPFEIQAVESTLPQLLSLLPTSEERKLQFYPLSKNQQMRRAMFAELPARLSTMKVVDGANKQELMVWGNETQHVEFAKFLKALDHETPSIPATAPRIYPLEIQDSPLIIQILTAEFPEAKFTPDAEAANLTVIADEASQAKIASRLQLFQSQLPKKAGVRLETYSVRGMTTAGLQAALAPLLAKSRVNLDTERNRLLVHADERTHEQIREVTTALSEQLNVDQQKVIIAYPLEHAIATQVKIVVDQLALGVTTIADDKLKQLVVTANLEAHATIKSTISQIDRSHGTNASLEVRSYDAKKLQAAALLPTLQKMWPDMQLTADAVANRVIASGRIKELDELDSIMQRLIAAPDGKPQVVKTYPVPAGEMVTLATILGQIAPQALISSDIPSRTVTVWANEEQQARVEQALEQLSKTAQSAKEAVTYLVKPTQVVATQTSLLTLFPTIGVATVPTTGQLIVVASKDQQKKIAEVIELLARGPNASEQSIRVFQLDPEKVDLSSLLSGLQVVLPSQIRLEPNLKNSTLLAIGTQTELELVATKIEELQKQLPDLEKNTTKVYRLQFATPTSALTMLTTIVPKATLVQDPVTRTIAATAKPKEHRDIEAFLSEYDIPKEPATYILKPTQITAALTSLRTLFPSVDMTSDLITGQLIVVASTEQQARIAEVIELMANGPNAADKTIRVFQLDPDRVELLGLLAGLQATLPSQIRLEPNPKNYTILAIGTPDELKLVSEKVEQLQEQLPKPEASRSEVYSLRYGNPLSALTILQSLVPKATIVQDAASKTISANAKRHEHEKIQEFLKAFDQPKQSNKETTVYRLRKGGARGLSVVLTELMPDAVIYGSREEGVLIATASAEQHVRIAAIVRDYEVDLANSETRVFPIGKASATSLKAALEGFSKNASITADLASNSLIVTAGRDELEKVAKIVQEVESGGATAKSTRFYPLTTAEPLPASKALGESFPKARFAPDATSGGLFVTATEEEQAAISEVVSEINNQPSKLPSLKAFVLRHGDPARVAESLTTAFGRRSTVGVSFSRDAKSVFVVGSQLELATAESLIAEIDVPPSAEDSRQMRTFPLNGSDGKSISLSIETLFKNQANPVDVKFDSTQGQLFVIGEPSQLREVEEAMKQIAPPTREMEIISLEAVEPYSFRNAVEALFADEPNQNKPLLSVDSSQQQIVVRATTEQLASIRRLLTQMGERSKTPGQKNSFGAKGNLRFFHVHRDSDKLIEELNQLWPKLRSNPIQVIQPQSSEKPKESPGLEEKGSNEPAIDFLKSPKGRLTGLRETTSVAALQDDKKDQLPPPIIVVVGEEQWTLASEDSEALDQLTQLLDTIQNPRIEPIATTGNYSVYILRHADAKQMQRLLTDLFKSSDSFGSSFQSVYQRVKVVAETRINALVISGSRADRRIVEELLSVFDSRDLIETLQQVSPTVISLEHASASNVSKILEDVYRAQLKSGAGRDPMDIPEGVSSEVATVLQQINAQASGPLLTISIDETTNGIILRGPVELTMEVKTFIEKLDQRANDSPGRRVQVLRLESTNAKNIEKALRILLK